MKKLVLTSLLAVFAVSAANATTNIIDGNPLYRPNEGRFYSVTAVETDTDFRNYTLGEELGFGISDTLAVTMSTALYYFNTPDWETIGWDHLSLGLNYRYINQTNWKADVYGKGAQIYNTGRDFTTLETIFYNWTVGTRFGWVDENWTLAATVQADYFADDVDGFDYDAWGMKLGLEGQYIVNSNWNFVGGLDYNFNLGSKHTDWTIDQPMNAKLGVNYNLDCSKYFGAYVFKDIKSGFNTDPLGVGVKFGIDF